MRIRKRVSFLVTVFMLWHGMAVANPLSTTPSSIAASLVRDVQLGEQRTATPMDSVLPSQHSAPRRAQLMVLVSLSVPRPSLLAYLRAAQRCQAAVVLRGFVQNSMTQTAKYLHQLIGHHAWGVSIDPNVFSRLNIQKVPAIVLFTPQGLQCLNEASCLLTPNQYDIVYGNVTLAYALEQFSRRQGALAQLAKSALSKLNAKETV